MAKEKEKLVEIVETKNVSLKGYTFIEGFPDLGLAGTIGTKYLVDKLKFEQFGYADSRLFLPMLRIQGGLPLHPVRLYVNKKSKVAAVVAEQMINNLLAAEMAQTLVAWVKKKGITRVISTSGVRIPDGKSVYAFASNEKSKKIIKENKIELIENGITSGVTALLMLGLRDNNIEAFCLLGNAKNSADYNAAAEVVKAICGLTGMRIDIKPLLEDAKKMQQVLTEHLKTLEQSQETKPDSTPMYT
ncbi:PAC2 family protein [uncultured archaeon]|nr:PAC2 family protein [uncultured archaeon]